MDEIQINRFLQILTISAFLLIPIAVINAWLNPAIGNEYSIYASTPIFYWVTVTCGYSVSLLLVLLDILGYGLPNKLKYAGYILLGFSVLLVASVFIIRGYLPLFMTSDTGSHIGILNNLLSSGFVDAFYPAPYLLTGSIGLFTNLSIYSLVNLNSLLFLFLIIIGIYITVKNMFPHKGERYLTLLVACLLPFGCSGYTTGGFSLSYYLPYLAAIAMIPLYIYCIFKITFSNRNIRYFYIIAVLIMISLLFYHPLIFFIGLLFSILHLIVVLILHKKYSKIKERIQKLIILICILTILFIMWTWIQTFLQGQILSLSTLLTEGDTNTRYMDSILVISDSIFAGSYSLLESVNLFLRSTGLFMIMMILCLVSVPIVYKNINKSKNYYFMVSLYALSIPIGSLVLLSFLASEFHFQPGRVVIFLTLIAIFSAGIVLNKILDLRNNFKSRFMQYLPILGVIIILISIGAFGISSYYPSTQVIVSPTQVTYSTLNGMDFYLTETNYDYYQTGTGIAPLRYAMILYNSKSVQYDINQETFSNQYLSAPPTHFNYTESIHLGSSYTSTTYLVLRGAYIDYYENLHLSQLARLTSNDVVYLEGDASVNKLYDGTDIDLFLIHGFGNENYEGSA